MRALSANDYKKIGRSLTQYKCQHCLEEIHTFIDGPFTRHEEFPHRKDCKLYKSEDMDTLSSEVKRLGRKFL